MIKLGGIGTILIVGFIIWCLLAPTKTMQLDRACRPVDWAGSISVSLVAVSWQKGVPSTARSFEKIDYTCQYTLWRLFYEKAYQRAVRAGKIDPRTGKPIRHRATDRARLYEQDRTSTSPSNPDVSDSEKEERSDRGTTTRPSQDGVQEERPYAYPLSKSDS